MSKVEPNLTGIQRQANSNLLAGRSGTKNKTTLFKEAMREGFEQRLENDGIKVFNAVVQKAIGRPSTNEHGELLKDEEGNQMYLDGDVTAQKMIMDRIVPVVDTEKVDTSKFNISINVSGLTPSVEVIDAKPIEGEVDEVE